MATATRQCIRIFGVIFALTLCVIAVYDYLRPRIYEATGVVGLARDGSMQVYDVSPQRLAIKWITPNYGRVAEKIPKSQQAVFMKPYDHAPAVSEDALSGVLKRNMSSREVSEGVEISYQHPDPSMALLGATLFVEDAISNYAELEKATRLEQLGELELRLEHQKRNVEEMIRELDVLRARQTDAAESSVTIDEAHQRLQTNVEFRNRIEKRITEMRIGPDHANELKVLNPPTLPHPDSYLRPRFLREFRWRLMLATALGGVAAMAVGVVSIVTRRHVPADKQPEAV